MEKKILIFILSLSSRELQSPGFPGLRAELQKTRVQFLVNRQSLSCSFPLPYMTLYKSFYCFKKILKEERGNLQTPHKRKTHMVFTPALKIKKSRLLKDGSLRIYINMRHWGEILII